jgi:hypothetical protein
MRTDLGLALVSWCRHGPHAAIVRNLHQTSTQVVWRGRSKWENPASPIAEGQPVLVGETDLCHARGGCRLLAFGVARSVQREGGSLTVEIDLEAPAHEFGWTSVDDRFLITKVEREF